MVFDVTNRDSFEGAKSWVKELQRRGDAGAVIALAGNKADIRDGRAVTKQVRGWCGATICTDTLHTPNTHPPPKPTHTRAQEAIDYANEAGVIYMDTSAKTGENVREIFAAIARALPRAAKGADKDVLTDLGEMAPPAAGKGGGGCCGGGGGGGGK